MLLFILGAAVTSIKGVFYQIHGHADISKLIYTTNTNNELSTTGLMKHCLHIQLYPALIMLNILRAGSNKTELIY
jgi:glucan phosphoethanolaminetransferase (alkaline phosphatase superfamily)